MLDDAQRRKILEADLANVVRKVKAGKPLSQRERHLVETAPAPVATKKPERQPTPAAAAKLPQKAATIGRAVSLLNAAGLSVTVEFLRQLKRDGVPGFEEKSGRINLAILVPEIRKRLANQVGAAPLEGKAALEVRKLLAQAETLEFNLAQLRGEFVRRSAIVAANRRLAVKLQELDRALETDMPGAVAGQDIIKIREWARRFVDLRAREIQNWADEFPE